ncbi:uncharacterized protein LOC121917494 [Sceloporus undulatus]|uniref:uncharacterized protein LOC121917494 n=1 Tax=Sceloporus undulatus TaxID=8520 RepID=UPI001C4BFF74|nr:uncharacterized protein LOC121917494 [Sceloporus undulatus]
MTLQIHLPAGPLQSGRSSWEAVMARRKGSTWANKEIDLLLRSVRGSGKLKMLMRSRSMPILPVHREVAAHLKKHGYNRTVEEVFIKFKKTRDTFLDSVNNFGPSPPKEKQPPFFNLMKELWLMAGNNGSQEKNPSDVTDEPSTSGIQSGPPGILAASDILPETQTLAELQQSVQSSLKTQLNINRKIVRVLQKMDRRIKKLENIVKVQLENTSTT